VILQEKVFVIMMGKLEVAERVVQGLMRIDYFADLVLAKATALEKVSSAGSHR
jgi:hypothetical protein